MPKIDQLEPYWQSDDKQSIKMYCGDVLETLKRLPTGSVHCAVTSPPYYGLRDYSAGHKEIGNEENPDCLGWASGKNCAEDDWENGCFVCRLVLTFRELRRVLRDEGTFWLNLGDTYSGGKTGRDEGKYPGNLGEANQRRYSNEKIKGRYRPATAGIPKGNLIGVPWRVALAMQKDGWCLRQDIIWAKLSPMPESIKNRCTKAHEYLFMFTKGMDYYFDRVAIREKSIDSWNPKKEFGRVRPKSDHLTPDKRERQRTQFADNTHHDDVDKDGRNKRSVWRLGVGEGFAGDHFGTFPKQLVRPCILAGSSHKGCCAKCGKPWERIVEEVAMIRDRPNEYVKRVPGAVTKLASDYAPPGQVPNAKSRGVHYVGENTCGNSVDGVGIRTLGWRPTCECHGKRIKKRRVVMDGEREVKQSYIEYQSDLPAESHPIKPCVVLDPFMGSGTTAVVAVELRRHAIGIDLSQEYMDSFCVPRLKRLEKYRYGESREFKRLNSKLGQQLKKL